MRETKPANCTSLYRLFGISQPMNIGALSNFFNAIQMVSIPIPLELMKVFTTDREVWGSFKTYHLSMISFKRLLLSPFNTPVPSPMIQWPFAGCIRRLAFYD